MAKSTLSSQEVDDFMRMLEHPLHAELSALRALIMAVDSGIEEGIKWNAPSFFYRDYFATFNLRSTDKIQAIFHTGAKVKASATEGLEIDDPYGTMKWLAKDRCMLTLQDMADLEAKRESLESIIRQWIQQM
ncbi:MAG: DUF1801 domain-containing protein [Fimbriimonadaceae bacterium]|nr:MAG: DUF1801 domain-containing protein [Fimbriimonadaceae bacterium]